MKIVNKQEFLETIKEGYTLVDFYADWCGPCKMLGPVLEELDSEYPDVAFVKVNVDNEEELAASEAKMLAAIEAQKAAEEAAKQEAAQNGGGSVSGGRNGGALRRSGRNRQGGQYPCFRPENGIQPRQALDDRRGGKPAVRPRRAIRAALVHSGL